jgi:hypothetical protein
MGQRFMVVCRACDGEHDVPDVEFVSIEEDVHGRDLMTFECPLTRTEEKSVVHRVYAQ